MGLLAKRGSVVDWRYKQKCVQWELLVKQSEFKRWLEGQGAIFKQGKKHLKVYVGSRQSTLPRHPSHEIGESLRKAIIRQLGLK
jgi:mRNA interferase HicA